MFQASKLNNFQLGLSVPKIIQKNAVTSPCVSFVLGFHKI